MHVAAIWASTLAYSIPGVAARPICLLWTLYDFVEPSEVARYFLLFHSPLFFLSLSCHGLTLFLNIRLDTLLRTATW
jgi:hypothetical protein